MITWGDGSASTAGTIVQTGSSPNGSTFSVNASHIYTEEGTYQTQVTITDLGGSQTVAVGNAVIADAPLTAAATQPAVNVTEKIPFTIPVGAFVDGNPDGEISDFTATIDWGDGTPNSAGTILQPGGPGTAFLVSGSHTYALAGAYGSTVHDPIFVFVHDVGGSAVTIANTASIAYVPLPKVTAVAFNRVQGEIQVAFQVFGGPSNDALKQAALIDANNYSLTKYRQHGPAAYKVTSITVSPPTASGAQVVTLQINGGKYLRGGHYFLDIRSVSPKDLTGIQDIYGDALDGEFYNYFPSGNNVPGGDFIAELDAIHHTIYAPRTVVGTATPVSPPGTLPLNTRIPTFAPGDPPAKKTADAKAREPRQSVAALRVAHRAAAAARSERPRGASVVIDRALDQLTADKRIQS
jgi:PKD repeat protein